jgi:hypothetical protein
MEGYSVTEAASVLGVPTERVWELLARGVLAGAPEGDTGMRVYLQPRPAPGPAPVEPAGARGNGGSRDESHELSPFRELLTEFRNLTERYGQALLALGESRGEVASLRSRVDMLEARIELRLPSAAPASSWSAAGAAAPMERTITPPPATASTEEEHRHRSRGPRRATESFAEALARAEDPSPPELRVSSQPRDAVQEAALPRDLPAAEPVPVADEAESVAMDASLVAEEIAAFAEEAATVADDATIQGPAESREPAAEGEPMQAVAELEPVPAGDALAAAVGIEPLDELEPAAEVAPVEPDATREPQPEAAVVSSGAAEDEVMPEAEPLEWDAERYTTAIEEPDWLEAEAYEPPAVMQGSTVARPEPPAEAVPEPEPAIGAVAEMEEPGIASPPEPDASEPAAILEAETAGAAELEAPPVPPHHQPTALGPLPGAEDLDAALQALRRRTVEEDARGERWASAPVPPAPRSSAPSRPMSSPLLPPRTGTPPVTPAGRAYRRLRRIFPG